MQFSVDAKGIAGLSVKAASMKSQCQPQLSLPVIKNTTPRGSKTSSSVIVPARKFSNPQAISVQLEPAAAREQLAPGEFYFDETGNLDPEFTPRTMASIPSAEYQNRKPTGMTRAKTWSLEVENSFRYQLAGWMDISEYLSQYTCPEVWPESGMIKCLQNKKTGYYMYFRQHRECEDKYLNRVKLYRRE